MASNPYTLTFGREPARLISRDAILAQIEESFAGDPPSQQVFLITDVQGSGKTVLMTELSKRLRREDEWVVIELNPERDMLQALAAKLSSDNGLASIFQSPKINLSFFELGLEVSGAAPITDIEVALARMLEGIKKHGKKVLVTVDEVVSTQNMRVFASAFQILMRQDLPIFLVMTGLYDNIRSLQDEETLTFLYRAPKIEMSPLNLGVISRNYQTNLGVSESRALEMARLTKGYSFAFQVLGYFAWQHGTFDQSVVGNCKQYLDDCAYEKIWSELSAGDRRVALAIAQSESGKVSDVRRILGMETNQFNPYRARLIRKGIVDGSLRGYVSFALPLFERYVIEHS
jgi:hypothetical protein